MQSICNTPVHGKSVLAYVRWLISCQRKYIWPQHLPGCTNCCRRSWNTPSRNTGGLTWSSGSVLASASFQHSSSGQHTLPCVPKSESTRNRITISCPSTRWKRAFQEEAPSPSLHLLQHRCTTTSAELQSTITEVPDLIYTATKHTQRRNTALITMGISNFIAGRIRWTFLKFQVVFKWIGFVPNVWGLMVTKFCKLTFGG